MLIAIYNSTMYKYILFYIFNILSLTNSAVKNFIIRDVSIQKPPNVKVDFGG